jgi:hypothetical protein
VFLAFFRGKSFVKKIKLIGIALRIDTDHYEMRKEQEFLREKGLSVLGSEVEIRGTGGPVPKPSWLHTRHFYGELMR